jgi:hypothetical protein
VAAPANNLGSRSIENQPSPPDQHVMSETRLKYRALLPLFEA